MAEKWIGAMNGGKGPKKGALHKEMGVPAGEKIPKSKLEKAAKSKGILGKRARLAEILEGLNHGGAQKQHDKEHKTLVKHGLKSIGKARKGKRG